MRLWLTSKLLYVNDVVVASGAGVIVLVGTDVVPVIIVILL